MFFGDALRFLVIYTAMVLFTSVVRVLCLRIESFQRTMTLESVDKINECDPSRVAPLLDPSLPAAFCLLADTSADTSPVRFP
jgi:hypothetical protein